MPHSKHAAWHNVLTEEKIMQTMKHLLVAVLLGINLASPVLATEAKTCLQNNRIWGWQAVNDHTLILTDRSYDRYTVNLRGGCVGLDKYSGVKLAVRTKTSLGCLSAGDTIAFESPGLGPLSCSVSGVRAGVPSVQPGPDVN
jgi:hypothetical protein